MKVPVRTPLPLKCLSGLHSLLAGRKRGRRLLRRLRVRRAGRAWLRRAVLDQARAGEDDVTVVIGIRDRDDTRIVRALRSLRDQIYPAGTIQTLVVDWGSAPSAARFIEEACREFGATYLRVDDVEVWSRARCLNVGIRRADTTFLMTADADIVFSPEYVADAVRELRRSPLSVVYSPMFDLPEASSRAAERSVRADEPFPLEAWREKTTPRLGWDFHPSIGISYTAFYQLVRGYDEYYEVWGKEDEDLYQRLERLGLEARRLESDSFYLHQWHPKFEGVPGGKAARQIERNREHFRSNHSIVRNDRDWGRPAAPTSTRDALV